MPQAQHTSELIQGPWWAEWQPQVHEGLRRESTHAEGVDMHAGEGETQADKSASDIRLDDHWYTTETWLLSRTVDILPFACQPATERQHHCHNGSKRGVLAMSNWYSACSAACLQPKCRFVRKRRLAASPTNRLEPILRMGAPCKVCCITSTT